MAEHTFKLSDKGTEYPARFGGHEIRYNLPDAVPGDVAATVQNLLAYIEVDESVDPAEVLTQYFNGYGRTYDVQGDLKRFLASDEVAGMSLVDALAAATERANARKAGTVTKRTGVGGKGKVAKAEAERDAAKSAARDMFARMPANLRKQFRPQLIEAGTFTADELDSIEAEIGK